MPHFLPPSLSLSFSVLLFKATTAKTGGKGIAGLKVSRAPRLLYKYGIFFSSSERRERVQFPGLALDDFFATATKALTQKKRSKPSENVAGNVTTQWAGLRAPIFRRVCEREGERGIIGPISRNY